MTEVDFAFIQLFKEHVELKRKENELRVMMLNAMKSFECYSFTGPAPKPKEEWDEYDAMMGPIWIEIKEKMNP